MTQNKPFPATLRVGVKGKGTITNCYNQKNETYFKFHISVLVAVILLAFLPTIICPIPQILCPNSNLGKQCQYKWFQYKYADRYIIYYKWRNIKY